MFILKVKEIARHRILGLTSTFTMTFINEQLKQTSFLPYFVISIYVYLSNRIVFNLKVGSHEETSPCD